MKQRPIILITVMLAFACSDYTGGRSRAIELNNHGARCLREQHLDSALIYFTGAIEADSTLFTAYGNRCNVLWMLDRDTEALATARCLTRVKNTSVDAFALEGLAYEHLGELEKAKDSYNRSLRLSASESRHAESWLTRSNVASLLTVVEGKPYGLEEIERILSQHGDSLSILSRETLTLLKNEIQAYQGGGILEFLSTSPSHQYCLRTDRTPEEIRSYFLGRGINVQVVTVQAGSCMLEIKDKFRMRARELGLVDCPEQP